MNSTVSKSMNDFLVKVVFETYNNYRKTVIKFYRLAHPFIDLPYKAKIDCSEKAIL